jgi:membrane-associated phospholipid phosphatase
MIDIRRRGAVIAVAYCLFCIVYLGAARLAIGPPHVLSPTAFDRAVPFMPWTIVVYLSQFAFMFLALWLCRDAESLTRMLTAIAIATLLSAVVFIAYPTMIERPATTSTMFATLYLFDVPANCFPSLHVALALIAAAMWPRPSTRVLAYLWVAAIAASTLTTKQHMAVDVVGGCGVAAPALLFGLRMRIRNRRIADAGVTDATR